MAEFIIVFREVLEASLVVGIIYLLIEKTNQNEHFSQLMVWSVCINFSQYCSGLSGHSG